MSPASPKLVILDTDPGVDDALALLYLRAQSGVRLLAITTVFGNADIDATTRNALYLRDRFAPSAPVHRGAEAPLSRPRGASPVHVHGHNGLGDIDLGDFAPPRPEASSAADRIVELVRAHPGQITLLAIGPLTNLALALRAAPDIADLVAEVVVMGGAFGEGGRGGNVTPFAEANIHNDPEAAAEVLSAAWPVTLVGLDVTTRCVLPSAAIRALAGSGAGRFVDMVTRGYVEAYGRFDGLDGCCLHDVAAAAYVLRPELFTVRTGALSVALDGEHLGQTQWDTAGRPQRVCLEVEADQLVEHFLTSVRAADR
jgi:inosine-uridine nucleoside N-ribohydrolase